MAIHYLCVVARGQHELLERLQRWFRDDREVVIVVDRRRAERRVTSTPVEFDRRATDRRRQSYVETQVGLYGRALVKVTTPGGSPPLS